MTESNLTSAKYYEPADKPDAVAAEGEMGAPSPARSSRWERYTSRLSLVVGAALVVCFTMRAVGFISSARDRVNARAEKSTHFLDWFLWFGGAEDDQTFEKFIKDSSEKQKREWDEKYRNSPAYHPNPQQIDWRQTQFKFEPPSFTKPPRRSR